MVYTVVTKRCARVESEHEFLIIGTFLGFGFFSAGNLRNWFQGGLLYIYIHALDNLP